MSVQTLPRWMGVFLLIMGVVFIVPSLAIIHMYMIPELWNLVVETTGWSYLMFGWAIGSLFIVIIAFAYGSEILWYDDKKANIKSIDEKAKSSEFKPKKEELDEVEET